ncbi:ABC transporter permease [Gordonia humi]|uniref:Iron(III) transport system permease protein n=1 Tax=Gordonia humi TaxID=686429 RepID=A0A840EZ15_9ACTN|nr:iron ABC transporter permease [Gordonia humi]MBB4134249.1 iron(III) transport system permease protein [Gordonia humi]
MTAATLERPPLSGDKGSAPRAQSMLWTDARRRFGVWVLLLIVAFLVGMPLIKLQGLAFEDGAAGYDRAFHTPELGTLILRTVYLAVGSMIVALVLGTLLAYAASRLPRRAGVLRAVPIIPIVLPAIAMVVGWAFLLSPGPGYLNAALRTLPWWDHLEEGPVDVYSLPWIIIVTGFGLTSFVYLFVSAGMASISADHLEAAHVAGSSGIGVFFKVILPLLRPSLIYGAGVGLLLGLGQFTAPLLLGTNQGIRVLTTQMYFSTSQVPVDYAAASALGSPLLLFGVLVVIAQKLGIGDQTRFVTHGGKGVVRKQRSSPWAATFIAIYGIVAVVLPMVGLLIVALSPYWNSTFAPSTFTLDNFKTALESSDIVEAIVTSLLASIAAVVIVLPIGYAISAIMLHRRGMRVARSLLDFLVALPLGVPAVIFGAGFLLTYSEKPFILYGTPWVIILVYATLMLPFATRMMTNGMLALGTSYQEASWVNGGGRLRTHLVIMLPLLRSSIGGAVALIFVLLTHEFSASMLVRSPTTQVMGTVVYDFWSNGAYPTVAAVSIVMTLVTAAGVLVAMGIGGRDVLSRL